MAALTGISSNVQVVQEAMMYAAALQDQSIPSPEDGKGDFSFAMMAMWAYKQADAMMAYKQADALENKRHRQRQEEVTIDD